MRRRVVVTGLGVISAIGIGKDAFWQGLKEGRNGIHLIKSFDTSHFPSKIAGEIHDFDPLHYMDKKDARKTSRFIQLALAASQDAIKDASLKINEENAERVGVMIGTGIGGLSFMEEQAKILMEKGPTRCSPFTVPMMITNMAAGMVGIMSGAKGPNSCVVTACATGTNAIGDAFRWIQRGDADVAIAGGTEAAITPLACASFAAARALSTRNDQPERASRPFDKERDGFVMGEGAGILILEELESAKKRGVPIYAELAGYGMSGDAYHMTSPSPAGEGAARCMRLSLEDAGMTPEQVDYINAHGTSTELNDKFETLAIKSAFGDHAKKIKISSTKSMIGHLLGAAGGVEAIATILCMKHHFVHPTINYEVPDPECDLDYVPNQGVSLPVQIAMSNSFGFGGHNATVVFKNPY